MLKNIGAAMDAVKELITAELLGMRQRRSQLLLSELFWIHCREKVID